MNLWNLNRFLFLCSFSSFQYHDFFFLSLQSNNPRTTTKHNPSDGFCQQKEKEKVEKKKYIKVLVFNGSIWLHIISCFYLFDTDFLTTGIHLSIAATTEHRTEENKEDEKMWLNDQKSQGEKSIKTFYWFGFLFV